MFCTYSKEFGNVITSTNTRVTIAGVLIRFRITKLIIGAKYMEIKQQNNAENIEVSIYEIAYSSAYDGPGVRVVVFFQGCNANCKWCHAPHSTGFESPLLFNEINCLSCGKCEHVCDQKVHTIENGKHEINRGKCKKCGKCIDACPASSRLYSSGVLYLPTKKLTARKLFEMISLNLELVKTSGGITLSGGEALMQKRGVLELLKLCKEKGISTAVETSGLLPKTYYEGFEDLVDCWIYGMRFTTGEKASNHSSLINESFGSISEYKRPILTRIPIIPGYTDDPVYLTQCLELMKKGNVNEVFLNPWNRETDHFYRLSGKTLKIEMPPLKEIEQSEEKIMSFFKANGICIKDMTEY